MFGLQLGFCHTTSFFQRNPGIHAKLTMNDDEYGVELKSTENVRSELIMGKSSLMRFRHSPVLVNAVFCCLITLVVIELYIINLTQFHVIPSLVTVLSSCSVLIEIIIYKQFNLSIETVGGSAFSLYLVAVLILMFLQSIVAFLLDWSILDRTLILLTIPLLAVSVVFYLTVIQEVNNRSKHLVTHFRKFTLRKQMKFVDNIVEIIESDEKHIIIEELKRMMPEISLITTVFKVRNVTFAIFLVSAVFYMHVILVNDDLFSLVYLILTSLPNLVVMRSTLQFEKMFSTLESQLNIDLPTKQLVFGVELTSYWQVSVLIAVIGALLKVLIVTVVK
jgi:hypothetical protein